MKISLLSFIASAALLLPNKAFSMSDDVEAARVEIVESRSRRSSQLETMLQDAKNRLTDHSKGRKLLDDEEKISLERKVELYTRKLEMLTTVPDDMEVERILHREKARDDRVNERREKQRQQGEEL
mmetsp:Transcript_3169/g.4264  ORF Transcript_3169/g.4264 Transcript_3169/m.4264 type:complete len:126 (-) Transcript_3169:339-716(-)|eukprot:CAMPEP_0198137888 /NCGR_PEP_ID=MMETSP1443-20131203/1320_1 /TAXON_ID=186043 /ORGANISM="Entomoneis sp., Strain CCMP2396" /LENGTH=125 /DNA_ID=CAMNT_0043799455 /DNA_START=84 /DNA_END=461 /DNA_ORIENTATION=-